MATFFEALGNAAKSGLCTILSIGENYARIGQGSVIFGDDGAEAAFLGGVRRQLCDQNPPAIPPTQVPSGQCPNVEYNIVVDYERFSSLNNRWDSIHFEHSGCNNEVGGPISGPRRYDDGTRTYTEWTYTKLSTGQRTTVSVNWSNSAQIRGFQYRYVRCDGNSSANCDAPNVPDKPDWNVFGPTNVTYNVGGNSYTIKPVFTFKGFEFDVNGNIVAAFGVNYIDADLNVNANIDLNVPIDFGGFNFDFGGNRDEQPAPTGDGCPPPKPDDADPEAEPPASEDPDETGEDDPVDPNAPVIRAVVVTVRNSSQAADMGIIQQEDNPDILIPNAGFVSFQIRVDNTVAWTSDIPVKNIRNFIPCPWDRGAIDVRGTPRPGVVWTLTPVLSKLDAD